VRFNFTCLAAILGSLPSIWYKPAMAPRISIQKEDPHSEAAARLIGELSAELARLYFDMGDDGSASFKPADASGPRSAFVVATLDAQPVGCGALRPMTDAVAEIKRMYVAAGVRRLGIGRRMLVELERLAVQLGYETLRLETGHRQPEAIRLYESHGFERIPAFGRYVANPWSVCFEKKL
jgi:putative acetyltransferase